MIYKIFWVLANIAIRVVYGKIEVSGLENIPKDGPLLIASNHPNGFLEPIIMACLFPRPLHFMVRGDVFRKPWLRPILIKTNQIPIFRFKDGFKELRKNDSSLREAYKALDNDAAIILFIEGGTKNIKKLRPFQKGLARMASSYLDREETKKELNVLPVAINFVSPFMLRSRVSLNVGQSFAAKEYFKSDESKVKDIKRLTDDLYGKVEPLAFNVQEDTRQDVLNHTLRLAEGLFSLSFFPMVSYKKTYWPTFKSIADTINAFSDAEFEKFEKEMNSFSQTNPYHVKRMGKGFGSALIWTILAFIPGMIGLILNIIPATFAKNLPKKVLNKSNTVFIASIMLSSGVGFFSVYYIVMIALLDIFFGWKAFLFLLAWPLGFTYLFWKNNYRSSIARSTYIQSEEQQTRLIEVLSKYDIDLKNIKL